MNTLPRRQTVAGANTSSGSLFASGRSDCLPSVHAAGGRQADFISLKQYGRDEAQRLGMSYDAWLTAYYRGRIKPPPGIVRVNSRVILVKTNCNDMNSPTKHVCECGRRQAKVGRVWKCEHCLRCDAMRAKATSGVRRAQRVELIASKEFSRKFSKWCESRNLKPPSFADAVNTGFYGV